MNPAQHREQLIGMLCEAAEIEHCLMCTYLYGAFSLKESVSEDITALELTAIRRWRSAVIGIATDEMLHLALVNNLLVALGAKPHYRRFNFPISSGLFPADVALSLAPFDAATLDHFVYLERPADVAEADPERYRKSAYRRQVVANRLMAFADDYTTVGELYLAIGASIEALAAKFGESALFVGTRAAQLSRADFALPGLCTIGSTKDALAAIDLIVHQGEGSSTERSDSHYARFRAIREEWQALLNEREFTPFRPAARDPVMRSPIHAERVQITAEPASTLVDVGNACYELMLRQLMHFSDASLCGAAERLLLREQSILLMHAVAAIGSRLTQLPANLAYPNVNAGLTFTVSRGALGYLSHASASALLSERCTTIGARLLELSAHAPELRRYADRLTEAASDWHAIGLLGVTRESQPVIAPATPPPVEPVPATPAPVMTPIEGLEVARGATVSIHFEGKRCIHARHCVLGEPSVFVANQPGEWIFPDTATAERVAIVAQACPSGAIRYERHDGGVPEAPPRVNVVRVRENGPLAFHADLIIAGQADGYRATLCRCGQSGNKPYCDGSHTGAGFVASGEPPTRNTEPLTVRNGALKVEPLRNGPLEVRGSLEVCAGTGRTVDRVTSVRFCRCGQSQNKPFCDGSHVAADFVADGA
jgi:CDGSH-type Zn-finger protein/uncharacterized Fe-S cluster protein YjdI